MSFLYRQNFYSMRFDKKMKKQLCNIGIQVVSRVRQNVDNPFRIDPLFLKGIMMLQNRIRETIILFQSILRITKTYNEKIQERT